tara:strand:+ start:474 stop:599 length:126 start_codon:yes stop_codon:yes gene_type:complete
MKTAEKEAELHVDMLIEKGYIDISRRNEVFEKILKEKLKNE